VPDGSRPFAPIRPEQRVGDVADRCPGALEVMKQMGINHCCGAQLTLAEAAAAAGVRLSTLLEALDAAQAVGA
jgi:regulator of cell morphogenesis and NO signaling